MNIAIYGAGAMGTVLGAFIWKAGYEIDLINRNEAHVHALKTSGAQIVGKIEFTQKVNALLVSEMTKKYDIILLMTKQRFNHEIVTYLKDYLSDEGVICTMQNGLPELSVAEVIGKDNTIGCTMSWGATFHGNGVSELTSEPARDTLTFSIGKYGNCKEEYFQHIIKLLNTMGKVTVEENFIGARWAKLLVNAAFSGLSVISGATFGEISSNKTSKRLALKAIKECIEVAKAADIHIEPIQGKDVVKLIDYNTCLKRQISLLLIPILMRKHKNIRSGMLRDLQKGRPTEIDAINGVVSEYGKRVHVVTPINDKICIIVKDIEKGLLSPSWENIDSLKEL